MNKKEFLQLKKGAIIQRRDNSGIVYYKAKVLKDTKSDHNCFCVVRVIDHQDRGYMGIQHKYFWTGADERLELVKPASEFRANVNEKYNI